MVLAPTLELIEAMVDGRVDARVVEHDKAETYRNLLTRSREHEQRKPPTAADSFRVFTPRITIR